MKGLKLYFLHFILWHLLRCVCLFHRLKGQRCRKVKRCFSAESWFVFFCLFAGTARVISHHALLLFIVSACLNRFGRESSITSFYCTSNKSSLRRPWWRTCREARRCRPASAGLRHRRSVHKSSIFSKICGSDLIGRDWSLNHLQEERFRCMGVCSFQPLDSANKKHSLIQTKRFKKLIQNQSGLFGLVRGKRLRSLKGS